MKFIEKNLLEKFYFSGLFLFTGMLIYFVLSYICRAIFGEFDIQTVGVTEVLTYLFYGFGGGIIFCCAKDILSENSRIKSFSAIVFIYIVMILRDMGAQGWLTTHDTVVTKIRFFTSPNNPLYEKIIAGGIMLFIALVFFYVLIKHIKPLCKGIVNFEPVSWTVLVLMVWTPITQVLDRFPAEFLKATGGDLVEPIKFAMKIGEEGGESLLPLLIAIGFMQFCRLYCKKEN